MIPNLRVRDRELGKRSDVRSQLVLAQRYAARVMAALRGRQHVEATVRHHVEATSILMHEGEESREG